MDNCGDDKAANPKFSVSSGLLDAKHRRKMGSAIWTYLALLDWQTAQDGTVMRGETIQASIVATRLGCNERTVRRELERLQSEGYIRRNRSGDGWLIWISHPKKRFRFEPPKEPDRNVRSRRSKMSDLTKVSGQKCPVSRSKMSDQTVLTPLRGSLITLKETKNAGAREAQNPDFQRLMLDTITANHPEGHNPYPQLTEQAFVSRIDSDVDAERMMLDHQRWLPVWKAGRAVPDLHNWMYRWQPSAEPPAAPAEKRSRQDEARERYVRGDR